MPNDLTRADTEEVVRLLRSGSKIEAIKLVREKTGLGLKEAKDLVDTLISRHDEQLPENQKIGKTGCVLLLCGMIGGAVVALAALRHVG